MDTILYDGLRSNNKSLNSLSKNIPMPDKDNEIKFSSLPRERITNDLEKRAAIVEKIFQEIINDLV